MDKVVIISGASSGIGLETALLLQQNGYKVYGLARHSKELSFPLILADVSKEESLKKAIAEILQKEKHIDVLINNAGMGISGSIECSQTEDVLNLFQVNVLGMDTLTRLLLPYLRESQGRIINISSIAGRLTIPFQTYYSMSKASVLAYSEGLAMELRPYNVKVTSILPGDTHTGFTGARKKNTQEASVYQKRVERSIQKMEKDETEGDNPNKIAKAVLKVLKKKHPPLEKSVGFGYKAALILNKFLPKRFVNWLLYRLYAK